MRCCLGCTERRVGCHGVDSEGNYVCERWGKKQKKEQEIAEKKQKEFEIVGYLSGKRKQDAIKRQQHHK